MECLIFWPYQPQEIPEYLTVLPSSDESPDYADYVELEGEESVTSGAQGGPLYDVLEEPDYAELTDPEDWTPPIS